MTVSKLTRLGGWSVRWGARRSRSLFGMAMADPAKTYVFSSRKPSEKAQTMCYVTITGSLIPQPCERWSGILTTAIPMVVIGDGCSGAKTGNIGAENWPGKLLPPGGAGYGRFVFFSHFIRPRSFRPTCSIGCPSLSSGERCRCVALL